MMKTLRLLLALTILPFAASARVVINEIFYHAPNDIEDLEYVELHNSGAEPVDLSGWAFTKGVKYKFAPGTRLEAKGFLVLCRNADRFKAFYDVPVAGVFSQHLSRSGKHLQLSDASGRVVDSVRYQDTAPWPTGADGYSASLERICPEESGENVANWAASPMSADRTKPGGTPGRANANYSSVLPPVIFNVRATPETPTPDQSITVEADVRHPAALSEVSVLYRLAGPGFEKPEVSLPMTLTAADHYSVVIPGQSKDQFIRFRIQATAQSGARRSYPAQTEPRPALSTYVQGPVDAAKIPIGWIIDTTEPEFRAGQQRASSPGFRGFGPGMFGPGPGGGPPGPDAFGPSPDELARRQARTLLDRGLDLPGAWFELTVHQVSDPSVAQQLRKVFTVMLSERGKLMDDVIESPKAQEKLNTLPDVIRKFQTSLLESVKPLLNEGQNRALAAWMTKQQQPVVARPGMLFANPEGVVKGWVKLEGAWYALTAKTEIDPARFADLRNVFRQLETERAGLAKEAANLREPPDGFRELTERGDALDQRIADNAKPFLSPAQLKQLEDWQRAPDSVVAGAGAGPRPPGPFPGPGRFGGGPDGIPGGPGQFGGGPGGFRGGPGGFRGGPGGFRGGPGGFRAQTPSAASGRSAFVYYDPATGRPEVFDFVEVVPRASGQKVHFHKEKPFHQMTTINLIFEGDDAILVEPMAYELYRRVGMPAEQSYQVRLWLDGKPAGYYLLIEQPNRAFLRRNKIPDDGNLYKILWYEQGVVGQHEKKTRIHSDHDDIIALIDALNKTTGDEQWAIIQKNFDVDEVVNYFAASMALSNWDGFFNNYFTYHDLHGTGKWTIFPWDEDQTWGVVSMMGGDDVFYTMPITFGMNGDVPPGQAPGSEPPRGFGFGFGGGAMWWRQPGWFSGPLLANPQFRKLFLARTRQILETIYMEDVFVPLIDQLGERLKPEVQLRASLFGQDPERALEEFNQRLQRLRDHVKKRRAFLLAQDELKKP